MTQQSNFNTSDEAKAAKPDAEDITPEKITLWGEIIKGWHWVVFIWKMMGRFGGIRQLLSSIKKTVIMLVKRLLIQLQTDKR